MAETSTVYALSSGRLPSGVAVVRVSGPRSLDALEALAGRLPEPRQAMLAALRDPMDGTLIDRALVLSFPAPASFTGEDVAELHVHGGVAVVEALLRALGAMEGLRLAEPGEFSRRAFDSGKLDLSQAEGLADLIAAQTEAQRRLALEQAGGRLRDRAEAWRGAILNILVEVEADLDFGDEDDVVVEKDNQAVVRLRQDIEHVLADNHVGERIRDGLTIAVVGAPNVGKSSLINALARRDVAIVSDIPGTTRDVIELSLDLAGVPVTLVDTAGLRETGDPVEAEGIRRAKARAEHADLVLHVVEEAPRRPLGQLVYNKIDRTGTAPGERDGGLFISVASGAGMAELEQWLTRWAASTLRTEEPPLISRARQRQALERGAGYLAEAERENDPVLRAEALRLAARAMGQVTGRIGVEDVLDGIFGRFCIGK